MEELQAQATWLELTLTNHYAIFLKGKQMIL